VREFRREEKRLHVEIKNLKASRPEVREYELKMKESESTMSTREDTTSSKEHLEKELKVRSPGMRVLADLYFRSSKMCKATTRKFTRT